MNKSSISVAVLLVVENLFLSVSVYLCLSVFLPFCIFFFPAEGNPIFYAYESFPFPRIIKTHHSENSCCYFVVGMFGLIFF